MDLTKWEQTYTSIQRTQNPLIPTFLITILWNTLRHVGWARCRDWMTDNKRRAESFVVGFSFFASFEHLLRLNNNHPFNLLTKRNSFQVSITLERRTWHVTKWGISISKTCWIIPLMEEVLECKTVRWHLRSPIASSVRLWSFLVPGRPLTKVMYKLSLHWMGTCALNALNPLILLCLSVNQWENHHNTQKAIHHH